MSKTSFTYEHGGRTHSGSHEISSGMIFVTTEFGQKKTQLGNLRAETLAGMLARELAREAS
ncbi:hypothetical protein FNL55_12310 [Tardiphaga sp. vice352]|uniref:hypothetical protein n=1 Tax=unclassified Tardiphaga TaxID=2631404 RepID=UPI001162ECBF|nr:MULTISPECIES: hypothetical protein [unclassified Tardiphaga]QDM32024.1 hypothetical protein FNL55_12310 [Tardiphaga sp. vice352]